MSFCTRCGVANRSDANFCQSCSVPLIAEAESVIRQMATSALVNPLKSPGLAAVLSFFICGLGQIYNGQIMKGLLMIIAYAISLGLMLALIGFITTPILWIWAMIDAYRAAERINRRSLMTSASALTSR